MHLKVVSCSKIDMREREREREREYTRANCRDCTEL